MVRNEEGEVSHKRIIAYICVSTLCVCMIGSIFSKNTPSSPLVDGVVMVAVAAIAGTSVDKFAKNGANYKLKRNQQAQDT
jgi:undecaprenyl pyrophosphate phosphatase UppP